MNTTVLVVLILVGAVVVGLLMLWVLGWLFRAAVESTSHINSGFLILVVTVVIGVYAAVLGYLIKAFF